MFLDLQGLIFNIYKIILNIIFYIIIFIIFIILMNKKIFYYYEPLYKKGIGHWENMENNIRTYISGYTDYEYKFITNINKIDEYNQENSTECLLYSYFICIKIADIIKKIKFKNNIKYIFSFMTKTENIKKIRNEIIMINNIIKNKKNVYITTDNELLLEKMKIINPKCQVIYTAMIPYKLEEKYNNINIINSKIKILYYLNKQTDLNILKEIIKYVELNNNIELTIKIQIDKMLENLFDTMYKNLDNKNINVVKNFLNRDDYYMFLNQFDIIILNYTTHGYYYRTSGIFIDSIYLKKIVLTIKDTWMEKCFKNMNISNYYSKNNVTECINKLDEIISNIDIYKKNIEDNYHNIYDKYSINNIINKMIIY